MLNKNLKKMKVKNFFSITIFITILISCNLQEKNLQEKVDSKNNIKNVELNLKQFEDVEILKIDKEGFYGKYVGPEFSKKGDIAHQFSNKTTKVVGKFFKKSYNSGKYLKIDFDNTSITTNGLDKKGKVEFIIKMPFITTSKEDAFTGIAHCGTWVNQNNIILDSRNKTLLKNLNNISVGNNEQGYFTTPEGYKEYWVQFKHKNYQ